MKFFNKRSRLSDLGIPLHTGIKPFPFKLCIEKHRTAETLKPETRNFRPIRKQLLSRKKIASSQKNTCLCIGSGSGTGASVLRPDASFPEPTRRAPAVRKRNPGQRPPREKRQTSPELAPQSNRSCDGGGNGKRERPQFGHSLRMTGIRETQAALRRPAALYRRSLFSNSRK